MFLVTALKAARGRCSVITHTIADMKLENTSIFEYRFDSPQGKRCMIFCTKNIVNELPNELSDELPNNLKLRKS